jgi:hypothetical protein
VSVTPSTNSVQVSGPALTAAPTASAAPIPPAPTPSPDSITASPLSSSAAQVADAGASLPGPTPSRRAAGGLRIQLPLIQHHVAATPGPTAPPTARAEAATATVANATPPAAITSSPNRSPALAPATPAPPRPGAPADDPTRNYPYFGGIAAFLVAGWAWLRRGRRAP